MEREEDEKDGVVPMEALSGRERDELAADGENGTGAGLRVSIGPDERTLGASVGDMVDWLDEERRPASRRALRSFVNKEALEGDLEEDLAMEKLVFACTVCFERVYEDL